MPPIVEGVAHRWQGADITTPFINGSSGSGGALGYAASLAMPSITKTRGDTRVCPVVGLVSQTINSSATGYSSASFVPVTPGGFSGSNQGPIGAPNVSQTALWNAFETTAAAAGTVETPTWTTPGTTTGRQVLSYAVRTRELQPSVAGTPATAKASAFVNDQSGSPAFSLSGVVAGDLLEVSFHANDPAAVFTPPDGTWTQAYRQTHANGVAVGYWKAATDSTNSFTFTVATTTVPTVSSPAVVSAAHNPALVGDTVNVDTNTVYSTPTGHSILVFERQAQRYNGTAWVNITGADYTAASQGGLSLYTLTNADDGLAVRYASRAQNDAGWSDWSYSNQLSVLNPPVVAAAPTVATDGTPNDGDTVSVDVSPGALAARYTGVAIDTYSSKWQDDTGGSYADLSGATGNTLLLTAGQVGHHVRYAERAHNASGYSAWNYSAPITVVAHPPLAVTDLQVRLTGGSGNTSGDASLGGARGAVYYTSATDPTTLLDLLFSEIPGSVAAAGGVLYRVVAVQNDHPIDSWPGVKAFVKAQPTDTHLTLAVAVPTQAAGQDVPALASQTTDPGVTFTSTTDPTAGQDFGSVPAGSYRCLFVRLTIAAGTPANPTGTLGQLGLKGS